jgi:uncharacterized protein (TIGR03086 family)
VRRHRRQLFWSILTTSPEPSAEQLSRAFSAVADLIEGVQGDQWSSPTPCTDWTVHAVVRHLVGMNLVFIALVNDQPPPERSADRLGDDPIGAFLQSSSMLIDAFSQPGDATGEDRLQIRLYDLLAHGWDLAQATGQELELPNSIVEQSLAFAQFQLSTQPRTGRFNEAQTISEDAPALDRLAAFLGRSVKSG